MEQGIIVVGGRAKSKRNATKGVAKAIKYSCADICLACVAARRRLREKEKSRRDFQFHDDTCIQWLSGCHFGPPG